MNYRETAERYVREQLPELYNPLHSVCSKHQETLQFECELCQTGWMSPQLQHWLRVLEAQKKNWNTSTVLFSDGLSVSAYIGNNLDYRKTGVNFNLTTGQPATEADYKAFCEIVGITSEDNQ